NAAGWCRRCRPAARPPRSSSKTRARSWRKIAVVASRARGYSVRMISTRRCRLTALALVAVALATAPQHTARPSHAIRLAQVYADPIGEGDGQIGGPMMYGYPVGNGAIGGPMMYGAPAGEGDSQIGGPMMYGAPVGNGPIGGPMLGGAPVDSGGDGQ